MLHPRLSVLPVILATVSFLGCWRRSEELRPQPPVTHGPLVLDQSDQRHFRFWYAGAITGLSSGAKAKVWIPVATSNHAQDVKRIDVSAPNEFRETKESKHGNSLIFFEATANDAGEIPFSIEYKVTRRELTADRAETAEKDLDLYLQPAKLVPVSGAIAALLGDNRPSGEAEVVARRLYDSVNAHMRYDKPEGGEWGRGDATWACGSGFGNCTDFHSLFIAMCRESQIPARFEMGFPIPTGSQGAVAGYHCWAHFAAADRWTPVDISEADKSPEMTDYFFGNLTADRIAFAVGRDLELSPSPRHGPVNFLVYPHVEVEGRVHASLRKEFRFQSID
ncbi:MAG: transglutaminase domain-containing protein [Pirellulaceae bacterium]|nr:transglutaminase domain-containing protein [Pirellulaceae bacterium]